MEKRGKFQKQDDLRIPGYRNVLKKMESKMNNRISRIIGCITTLLLLTAMSTAFGSTGKAQDNSGYHYYDKLFGKQFSFTPKTGEIMIQFDSRRTGPGNAEVGALINRLNLTAVHDAIDKHRFGVYEIPSNNQADALVSSLMDEPSVRSSHQALVDQEGFTKYFIPDELTVQFEEDVAETEMHDIIATYACEIVKDHWTHGYFTLRVPEGGEPFEMIRELMLMPQVRFAELNVIGFNDMAFDPDDTNYSQQWALYNTGTTGGTSDADIDAREAWDVETGDPNVLIAIIDTGVDWDHDDLQGNIWENLGEDSDNDGQTLEWDGSSWELDPGDIDGVDDDGNGQVDDLIGWDFDNDDNDPDDDGNHGTACAGIAAAVTDNSTGVAGIAHDCRIMPVKIDLTSGMNANRADAINYAASFAGDYDGIVLSNSWHMSSGDFTAVHDAVVNAKTDDVVVCFASGNSETTPISYPAIYEQCIAVGATSECDEQKTSTSCDGETWWGSNYGDSLDIAAPGVNIYTTDRTGSSGYSTGDYFSTFNGTSAATPHVAGAAALVFSQHNHISSGPALTPDEVQDILEVSADTVGGYDYNHDATRPGHSVELGYGRLNVNRAMQEVIARAVIDLQPDPVDIALSIDRSGSMSGDKLSAAQNAASQVVRLMNTGDRIAVTSYSSSSSVDYYMNEITSETIKDDAITAINSLSASGMTSIGGGLITAEGQFLLASPANYPQSIILLSDGKSNTAPWVDYVLPLLPSTTDAYTIGFATSTTDINEDTLQAIADDTGGEYFFAGADGMAMGAPGSSGGMELVKSYNLSLTDAALRQMIDMYVGDVGDQFFDVFLVDIDPSIYEARFSLLWENSETKASFNLKSPSGQFIDPAVAAGDPLIDYLDDTTLASYSVNNPEPGTWELQVSGSGRGDKIYLSTSGYSLLTSTLNIRNEGLFLPMIIENKLLENGRPVTGAEVSAMIQTPRGQTELLELFDDGKHHDGAADDGLYANLSMELVNSDGSYTVETEASGISNQTRSFFRRYDSGSFYVPESIDPVEVSLPKMRAMPGTKVRIPVCINSDMFGRYVNEYEFTLGYESHVLKATGDFEVAGTMSNGWSVNVNLLSDEEVMVEASGPELEGSGVLVFLYFEVIGTLGQNSPISIELIELNSGGTAVSTTKGELIVGSSLYIDESVTVTLISEDPVIIIPASGGSFSYTISITNNSETSRTFDVWTMALLPGGGDYGPIIGPASVTLPGFGSGSKDFSLSVGGGAPAGEYEYVLNAGTYPGSVLSSDSLIITKLP